MKQHEALESLMESFLGFLTTRCIYVAVKLRIADQLAGGPLPIDEIARRVDTRPEPLYRIMRALAARGIFHEEEGRSFSLSPMASLLRSDIDASVSQWASFNGSVSYDVAGDLLAAVRDGVVPLEHRFGKTMFEAQTEDPRMIELMNRAFQGLHWPETNAILDACDLSHSRTFADIGGGSGHVAIRALQRYPEMKGVIFELPGVAEAAAQSVADAGLADRCRLVAGDFFERIPVEADLYFLRHILHDWHDAEAAAILKNVADAARPGARLMIAECLVTGPNRPDIAKLVDILVMVCLPGRERTVEEYRFLMETAGFEFTGATQTESIVSVVEGRLGKQDAKRA